MYFDSWDAASVYADKMNKNRTGKFYYVYRVECDAGWRWGVTH